MISCNIICKNSARYIGYVIQSVLHCVDEVVLVDSGSTDNTIDTILSFPTNRIRLVRTTWDGDFSHLRNVALEHSRNEWILRLDSDEIMYNCWRDRLEPYLSDPALRSIGWRYWRFCFSHHHVLDIVDGRIQPLTHQWMLFRRTPAGRFVNSIHETYHDGVDFVHLRQNVTLDDVLHVHFNCCTIDVIERKNRYYREAGQMQGWGQWQDQAPRNFFQPYPEVLSDAPFLRGEAT